jgi:hypothetical protein
MIKKVNSLRRHSPGWKYDLPAPNMPPNEHIYSNYFNTTPNHIDLTYLELSRSTIRVRGIALLGGIALLTINTMAFLFFSYAALNPKIAVSTDIIITCFSITLAIYLLCIPAIRLDITTPRDEPIRFNRHRQKVYFYHFKYDWFFFFSRHRWHVKPITHDWADLIAEACSMYAPGSGGLKENIMIAVRKPGTDEVIARYFFAHDIEEGKKYWTIARLYMQQGHDALPEFSHPPRDWNNDAEVSLIRRLAPKVQWPPDIDLESRTAPNSGADQ